MNIGDLVRHKHLGGIGIIVNKKTVVSNITMGSATKFTVQWVECRTGVLLSGDYFPAFLELVDQTDKNCPSK